MLKHKVKVRGMFFAGVMAAMALMPSISQAGPGWERGARYEAVQPTIKPVVFKIELNQPDTSLVSYSLVAGQQGENVSVFSGTAKQEAVFAGAKESSVSDSPSLSDWVSVKVVSRSGNRVQYELQLVRNVAQGEGHVYNFGKSVRILYEPKTLKVDRSLTDDIGASRKIYYVEGDRILLEATITLKDEEAPTTSR